MKLTIGFLCLLALLNVVPRASADPPTASDNRLTVELIAKEPDIVTPTGVAVDEGGRIFVIENHTHQRPAKYQGPATDRIRIMEDFGPDGKARKITTWAEGADFRDTMGIALGKDGNVFVATRAAIYAFRDSKGTGKADTNTVLARLETKTTYPHNGLSGFAIDALSEIYFGLGENFGAAYKLIAADKTTLTGGGEGGSIYRMKPDGTGLTRIATGFWNPFHMAFDRWGRLFAVDNDPDARGPCRQLHIVQDGDYGYRFKYGRKGIHPFQSWNGELPGTLPMVTGTAEAPSGIVAYESDGLPEEYRGLLLVTSWGDHVIEQFHLEPRGASFGAKKKIMVRGDKDFRPVGIAVAPDGSLIVSDWVDQSYPVHGKGRLWRIRAKKKPGDTPLSLVQIEKQDIAKLKALLTHPRRDVRLVTAETLARRELNAGDLLLPLLKSDSDPLARLHVLWALVSHSPTKVQPALVLASADSAPEVRAGAAAIYGRLILKQEKINLQMQRTLIKLAFEDPAPTVRLHAIQACGKIYKFSAQASLVPLLGDKDPFIFSAAISTFAKMDDRFALAQLPELVESRFRLGALLTLRRAGGLENKLSIFLMDVDPAVRRAAIQWVAEEQLTNSAELLDKAAIREPVSREVFEAWLTAKEILANTGPLTDATKEFSGDVYILKVLKDAKQPASLRTMALRMLRPDHPNLKLSDLTPLLSANDKALLPPEAIRALAWRTEAESQKLLRDIAADAKQDSAARLNAIQGLANSAASNADTRKVLLGLVMDGQFERDVLRSLRGTLALDNAIDAWWKTAQNRSFETKTELDEWFEQLQLVLGSKKLPIAAVSRPTTVDAWRKYLTNIKGQGNPAAGERVFFHTKGPRCFTCHRIDGRGEAVGPDLSRIGAAMNRDKIIESILEPSKDIAPAFVTWLITTRDGKQHTGVIAMESFDSKLTVVDSQGKRTVLNITDIEDREAQKTSIMPADLHAFMTRQEFVDLLTFLEQRK